MEPEEEEDDEVECSYFNEAYSKTMKDGLDVSNVRSGHMKSFSVVTKEMMSLSAKFGSRPYA